MYELYGYRQNLGNDPISVAFYDAYDVCTSTFTSHILTPTIVRGIMHFYFIPQFPFSFILVYTL